MTKFEALQRISGVREFSLLIFEMGKRFESPEALQADLSSELSEDGLRVLRSVAQKGNYPISFDGMQK